MSADHLLGVETVLSDGATVFFEEISLKEAKRRSNAHSHCEAMLYQTSLAIREQYATTIRTNWPRTWRRASGYNLNYLLPWSPAKPPQWFLWENREVESIAQRTFNIEEFLVRPPVGNKALSSGGKPNISRIMRIANNLNNIRPKKNSYANVPIQVLLHGHCYQKARLYSSDGCPVGLEANVALLKACGYQVSVVDSGCCGMAGAFGYEKEHYSLSLQVGELGLFPAVRATGPETLIAASGVSCRSQIVDNIQKMVYHPIELVMKFAELS